MKNKIASSVKFSWNSRDFNDLLKSCDRDDAVKESLKWLSDKKWKILEAGCGLGRVVKYLQDRSYKNVSGLELDSSAVNFVNKKYPELKIRQGNMLKMPYSKGSFDVVLSYGAIEHFPDIGLEVPLGNIRDVLRPGGIAIISVPCQNIIRQVIQLISLTRERIRVALCPQGSNQVNRNRGLNGYYVFPQVGKFFEYRLTKEEFGEVCQKAGFKILNSVPISHVDGLYHTFGRKMVLFENWEFKPNLFVRLFNRVLKLIPYLHNHMQLVVLRKK